MIIQLLFFNIFDFATYILGALTFFSAGLLFYDSWQINKAKITPLIRSIGFLLLSLVYIVNATSFDIGLLASLVQVVKIISLLLILYSIIKEPILHKPTEKLQAIALPLILPIIALLLVLLPAIIMLSISLWYLRRSTAGMDKQLKPAALAFGLLAVSEAVKSTFFWVGTTNVFWSKILAEHSLLWNIQMAIQLLGIIVLAIWIWGYIRFRLQIQLFITTLTSTFIIFLITTFFFSFLLLKNLENDALSHLKVDANVFQYALERMQLESLSHAKALSSNLSLQDSLIANNKNELYNTTSEFLITQNLATLSVASSSGEVLMRAEDKDNIGDTLVEDPIVKNALLGKPITTITINENSLVSQVFIKSAAPVVQNNEKDIIGAVVTGFVVDEAFLDGIKAVTGLDTTVYAGNKRTATTLIAPDGKSRYSGILETNKNILGIVLEGGSIYTGEVNVANIPYYAAYTPLKAYGGETIGMLFIGKPQTELLETAQASINLTFLGSVILMVLAIGPVFYLAKFIREQVEA